MNEIANILGTANHSDKYMMMDALLESGYGEQAMAVFEKENNLSNIMETLNLKAQDLFRVYKKLFMKIKSRKDALEFEEEIKDMDTAFDECPYPLFHSFADGMYTREMHINGGDLIVGKIHKNDYFVTMLTGRAWVVSEFGSKELIAPCSFKAKAGVKHIGFHLEDTVWMDTHNIASSNIEDAEKEIFADSYEDLDRHNNVIDRGVLCLDG